MALLRLNDDGRLCLKNGAGVSTIDLPVAKDVLLLIDISASMAGDKLLQAKNGAIDFSRSAVRSGFATGLAIFADRAAMICDPTVQTADFEKKVARIFVGLVGSSTNLAAGLDLAGKFRTLTAVVVVTDGQPNSRSAALRSAAALREKAVEILCIGTEDADRAFLEQLATRTELAMHVDSKHLQNSLGRASQLLLNK